MKTLILKIIMWIISKIFKEPSEKEKRDREIRKLESKIQKLYRKRRIAHKYHDNDSFNRINAELRDLETQRDKLRAGK